MAHTTEPHRHHELNSHGRLYTLQPCDDCGEPNCCAVTTWDGDPIEPHGLCARCARGLSKQIVNAIAAAAGLKWRTMEGVE